MESLTARQKRFIEEYLVDLNATQAAIRAGYNAKSAAKSASCNLKKPEIRAHIEKAMADLSRRTGVSQERVIEELSRVAFAEFDPADREAGSEEAPGDGRAEASGAGGKTGAPPDRAEAREIPGEQPEAAGQDKEGKAPGRKGAGSRGRTGKSAAREVRLGDKLKALELLGKHLGMFGDKAQGSMDKVPQIIDDIGGADET